MLERFEHWKFKRVLNGFSYENLYIKIVIDLLIQWKMNFILAALTIMI